MLMALEGSFQLGAAPSTMSSLMGLASSAGNPQESWMKNLIKFLCWEGYLSKTGEEYVVVRSVPIFKTNKDFVQRCVHPGEEETIEGEIEQDIPEPATAELVTEEPVEQETSNEGNSSPEESVLAALTGRVLELTEATRELRDAVTVQTSGSEALRLEIAKQREEFRALTSTLQAEVVATRTNNDSNAAAILEWITKSETIGEHSQAVIALRETVKSLRDSVKELAESVQPLKEGAAGYQKTLETVSVKYTEEMAVRHREIRESLADIHRNMREVVTQVAAHTSTDVDAIRYARVEAFRAVKARLMLTEPNPSTKYAQGRGRPSTLNNTAKREVAKELKISVRTLEHDLKMVGDK
jgi:hypothetical protein